MCGEQLQTRRLHLTKKKIIIEHSKNKAITEAFVKETGKDIRNIREKIPVIYDFWVKTNLI